MATKNHIISARILVLVAAGMTPVEALRTVCGATVADQMIEDLYHMLRKEVR